MLGEGRGVNILTPDEREIYYSVNLITLFVISFAPSYDVLAELARYESTIIQYLSGSRHGRYLVDMVKDRRLWENESWLLFVMLIYDKSPDSKKGYLLYTVNEIVGLDKEWVEWEDFMTLERRMFLKILKNGGSILLGSIGFLRSLRSPSAP